MKTKMRAAVTATVAGLLVAALTPAAAAGTEDPLPNSEHALLQETIVFKGSAATTPMSFTGFGPDKSLVQPDGKYRYLAPDSEPTDTCVAEEGITGRTSPCRIEMSGDLTSTKEPLTGTPLHGPVCDRTTGVRGTGSLDAGNGRIYTLHDVGWITSLQGSIITGRWERNDGQQGTFRAPVNTRRGLACASPEGATEFSISGAALFFQGHHL